MLVEGLLTVSGLFSLLKLFEGILLINFLLESFIFLLYILLSLLGFFLLHDCDLLLLLYNNLVLLLGVIFTLLLIVFFLAVFLL